MTLEHRATISVLLISPHGGTLVSLIAAQVTFPPSLRLLAGNRCMCYISARRVTAEGTGALAKGEEKSGRYSPPGRKYEDRVSFPQAAPSIFSHSV